jgi:predicted RNA-binding Zn-ribbon protein involved in translation (DUF1610 family)
MPVPEKERGPQSLPCPNCGQDASVRFSDAQTVEVACPDCGQFQIARELFDRAESDVTGPEEQP